MKKEGRERRVEVGEGFLACIVCDRFGMSFAYVCAYVYVCERVYVRVDGGHLECAVLLERERESEMRKVKNMKS